MKKDVQNLFSVRTTRKRPFVSTPAYLVSDVDLRSLALS